MTRGIHADQGRGSWSTHDATGAEARMAVEIGYRMTRLREEADHERLAARIGRRSSTRLWLGRALVSLGRFVEGAGPREEERGRPVRA